jgi:hypothetical protein
MQIIDKNKYLQSSILVVRCHHAVANNMLAHRAVSRLFQ